MNRDNIKIHLILDSIRSAFNVGSIFRSADGVGAVKIHICGITPTPLNPKVAKTALGSTENVQYEIHDSALDAVKKLKSEGVQIFGIELSEESINFQQIDYPTPVALVVGNEIRGVDSTVLKMCEKKIYIPMNGIKESLNVAIAAAIVMYETRRKAL